MISKHPGIAAEIQISLQILTHCGHLGQRLTLVLNKQAPVIQQQIRHAATGHRLLF